MPDRRFRTITVSAHLYQQVQEKAKSADGGKVKFYCELDASDYCPHTAFAAALPQVRNARRR